MIDILTASIPVIIIATVAATAYSVRYVPRIIRSVKRFHAKHNPKHNTLDDYDEVDFRMRLDKKDRDRLIRDREYQNLLEDGRQNGENSETRWTENRGSREDASPLNGL